MHASSLVFVVIIGIWAAYLLPDHLRRRRRLASANTDDRNSAQMRVLVRRGAQEGAPQEGAGSGALPAAPQRPALAAGAGQAAQIPAPRTPGAVPAPAPRGSTRASRTAGGAPSPSSRVLRRRRRLVGALVLLSAAGWTSVPLTALPWPTGAVPTAVLLLVLAALARHAAAPAPVRTAPPVAAVVAEELAVVVGQLVVEEPADGAADDAAEARRAAAAVPAGEWRPTPVPLPTYLLKPKAPPVRMPAAVRRVVDVRPFDQDVHQERRVASL